MRLSKIKLSGFKSFVDPTAIDMPSNLIGIVGPNGCGKSNTIDAVRWVMGESSAKHLRGASMEDVIFTGSSARKPVGQASVELVFDNSEAKLGGEYAEFTDISIKRQVSREGQSQYFLNGARCRRRDVTDIFLGTGLGPRSYAIIEQGMISRLIEAKPEDLRVYLEEAAGISKYKERRRETENRIRHTRDNLDRLNDLREEVDKQLARLKRQSSVARRYKEFKAEERQMKAQLLGLRWQSYNNQLSSRDQAIREKELRLEAVITELRASETSIEQEREIQAEASDGFNEVQAEFYRLGGEVSRYEQQIRHQQENHTRLNRELGQVLQSIREAEQHIEQDQLRIEEINQAMLEDEPAFDQLKESQVYSAEMLAQAEQKLSEWQTQWEQFNQRNSEPTQIAQVELSKMDQLERSLEQTGQRLQRLQRDMQGLDDEQLQLEIEELIGAEVEASEDELRLQEKLRQSVAELQLIRDTQQDIAAQLDEARGQVQALRGKRASLQALQQAALGEDDGSTMQWLQHNGLIDKPRLAQQIQVESGWEKAVESVLGRQLEAVCVDGIDDMATALAAYSQGKLTLLEMAVERHLSQQGSDRLLDKIRSKWPLDDLLAGIYCCETLQQALAMRQQLKDGESILTRDGVWVGPSWLRIGENDQQSGVLEREQQLNEIEATLRQAEQRVEHLQQESDNFAERLQDHENRRETRQQAQHQAHRNATEIRAKLSQKHSQLEQLQQRRMRANEELTEAQQHMEQYRAELLGARERRAQALLEIEALAQQGEQLRNQQQQLRNELEDCRQRANRDRDAGQQIAIRVESLRSNKQATEQNLQRMQDQMRHLFQRREQLAESLQADDEPIEALQLALGQLLEDRLKSEQALAAARDMLEAADRRLREHEQARTRFERQSETVRDDLQRDRLETQEVRVRVQTFDEQIVEAGFVRDVLLQTLPDEANVTDWQQHVDELERKINKLGPINLAAIDEYEEEKQRKEYLDRQYDDVNEALNTLETAIGKIDRETRGRFRETFERVNTKLQEFFPRLFGGGHAMLEMTGDDLLTTGVAIMARPPGKKVSNIHLLSGGEKALTAVAMVFAFFELNPSPFCMLDEVDAPLDDANVGRFCALVKEMSSRVQFIFITHNKLTMELSDQLMGVTMQEPGVSRLVAVDVEQASQLVDA